MSLQILKRYRFSAPLTCRVQYMNAGMSKKMTICAFGAFCINIAYARLLSCVFSQVTQKIL